MPYIEHHSWKIWKHFHTRVIYFFNITVRKEAGNTIFNFFKLRKCVFLETTWLTKVTQLIICGSRLNSKLLDSDPECFTIFHCSSPSRTSNISSYGTALYKCLLSPWLKRGPAQFPLKAVKYLSSCSAT